MHRAHVLLVALVAATTACATGARPVAAPGSVPAPAEANDGIGTAPTHRVVHPPRIDARPAAASAETGPRAHGPGIEVGLDVHAYEDDEQVRRYVRSFSGPSRASFIAELERGTRYDAMIRARLRAAGLPEDLRFVALVESGYDPQATSRAGAVGMWQFMAGTARQIGLRVDAWIDERRDPVRATDAAVRNLRWLRAQFGSMFLALAAYNGGETRVARGLAQLAVGDSLRAESERLSALLPASYDQAAIDATNVVAASVSAAAPPPNADARYFALASADLIRPETKSYVPKIIAALLVAKEPERFGVTVRPMPAYAFDTVHVAPLTPLAAVARAVDASREEMLDLNPHVLRGMTPPGAPFALRVPVARGAAAARALDALPAGERRAFRRVTTRRRETVAALAERAGVSPRVLRRYNPELVLVSSGKWKGRVVSGQALRVPTPDVLAYARDAADNGAPLGALPAPPPAPAEPRVTPPGAKKPDAPKPKPKPRARSKARAAR